MAIEPLIASSLDLLLDSKLWNRWFDDSLDYVFNSLNVDFGIPKSLDEVSRMIGYSD